MPHETLGGYGDRLLWPELGLQLNNRREDMLTEEEYVRMMMGFYPSAVEQNIRKYPGYFNRGGAGNGMGFGETSRCQPHWNCRRKRAAHT